MILTPEEAAVFHEDDEDPREVFAWFDGAPPDGVTSAPGHDAFLLRYWRCGTAAHGDCFSTSHLNANRVAWEGSQHARTCGCWMHGVLRAIGWPTVTGLPGSPHAVFEDWSLPHQLIVMFTSGGGISVTCTCLGTRRNHPRKPAAAIERRTGTFPARQAIEAHRAWHLARGLPVTARLP
jgi:hypothetical protein